MTSGGYNTPLITSIVVYVGSLAIIQVQNKMPIQNSPAMDIYKQLLYSLDAEGRYLLLNTMANQLRYPNSHTHFFSYVMLNLFFDSEDKEFVQEQITRVLLERLIVHRPHPVSEVYHRKYIYITPILYPYMLYIFILIVLYRMYVVGSSHNVHRVDQESSILVLAKELHPRCSRDRAGL
jgi:hypothetical protein